MHDFSKVAAVEGNPNWEKLIQRQETIDNRSDDVRSHFGRDYTRILHSLAYRRLKHKTQVFFNIGNDHICTRMEHVLHVESVSYTIANCLGLNTELTKAIAVGHDLGHAPFGHQGEHIINKLITEYVENTDSFWHERNGLRFVDDLELLEDPKRIYKNLNLTYAVRDGIISHCGEVDDNAIKPREELLKLDDFKNKGEFQAATWEGCIVKIADKIAYVGRDIEDAKRLGFLTKEIQNELEKMARENQQDAINTTVIMHNMIIDICNNSTVDNGICLSDKYLKQLKTIKDFNYKYIYKNTKLNTYNEYSKLVITEIFKSLYSIYNGKYTIINISEKGNKYPQFFYDFAKWLTYYCTTDVNSKYEDYKHENKKIYGNLSSEKIYAQAIIDYISGMTDAFAIKAFNELITF